MTGGGFAQRMEFHSRRRAGLKSPAGLRRHELDPPQEDGGTDFQGTAEPHGQPSGTPCSTGGPSPHQPLQSSRFQFQPHETRVAAGVSGP